MPSSSESVTVTIRPMTAEDIAELERLVHAAYRGGEAEVSWKNEHDIVSGPRITESGLRDLLSSSEALVLVAERNEATASSNRDSGLLGCVLVENDSAHDAVVIGMLAVSPRAQNLGMGRKLVSAAEKAAVEHFHVSKAQMHVAHVRSELLQWYQRLGYELTGEEKPFPGPEVGIQALKEGLKFSIIEKSLVK